MSLTNEQRAEIRKRIKELRKRYSFTNRRACSLYWDLCSRMAAEVEQQKTTTNKQAEWTTTTEAGQKKA